MRLSPTAQAILLAFTTLSMLPSGAADATLVQRDPWNDERVQTGLGLASTACADAAIDLVLLDIVSTYADLWITLGLRDLQGALRCAGVNAVAMDRTYQVALTHEDAPAWVTVDLRRTLWTTSACASVHAPGERGECIGSVEIDGDLVSIWLPMYGNVGDLWFNLNGVPYDVDAWTRTRAGVTSAASLSVGDRLDTASVVL